jgi:hypothetical protein
VQEYTTDFALEAGQFYKFKVEARNSVGYSPYSAEISILAAQKPEQPLVPTTSVVGDNVQIDWSIPEDGGTSITGYEVKIRHSDNVVFSEDLTNCDASQAAIVTAHSCLVPIATLIAAPYNLPWGASVYVTVAA